MRNRTPVENLKILWKSINIEIPFPFTSWIDTDDEESMQILRLNMAKLLEQALANIQANKGKSEKRKVMEKALEVSEKIRELFLTWKRRKSIQLVDNIQHQIKKALEKELAHPTIESAAGISPWVGNIFIRTRANPEWIRLLTITTNDLIDDQFDLEKFLNHAIKKFNKNHLQEVVNI